MLDRILPDWWLAEPARAGAAFVVFVNSVIALAVALGWLALDATQLALVYPASAARTRDLPSAGLRTQMARWLGCVRGS